MMVLVPFAGSGWALRRRTIPPALVNLDVLDLLLNPLKVLVLPETLARRLGYSQNIPQLPGVSFHP